MDGRRRPKPENGTSTFKDDASTFKGACRRPRIFGDGYGECVPADVLPRIHHLPPLVITSLVSFLLCAGWLPRIWTHDLQLLQQLDDPTHEPSPLPHGSASSYPAPLTWTWDPPYQGKSGVVWAREVLVYQVQDHVIKDMVTPNNTHDRPPLLTDTPERPSVASLEETMVMHSTAGTKGQSRNLTCLQTI
ncbi:uncharacterized protein [Triticum aestivum]|uniref:uncharacterized protein isoform X2 n=1 Tax=Triticum aestivum TaxID=4565 RepID=UPI001D00F889|nr:uncharacterized protein LOC123168428 isoform X2 [Triticum aestivum]